MVEIKTFVEVANNVNKVGKGEREGEGEEEGLYLSYNIETWPLLDSCHAIQVCYQFITLKPRLHEYVSI